MSKVSPFLWFDHHKAEEAVKLYVSLLPNAKITKISCYPDDAPGGNRKGDVMTVEFEIDGVSFVALNGGPEFKFNEAFSLSIACDSQAEVDRYWDALTADGGEEGPCGWLKDRYGLSWQVNPRRLGQLLGDPDPKRAKAAMGVMLQQKKIIIAEIEDRFADPEPATLLAVRLETGRTHQIRVHLAAIGPPVIGDRAYGDRSGLPLDRPFLHSRRVRFEHPVTGEACEFESPLPDDLEAVLAVLS